METKRALIVGGGGHIMAPFSHIFSWPEYLWQSGCHWQHVECLQCDGGPNIELVQHLGQSLCHLHVQRCFLLPNPLLHLFHFLIGENNSQANIGLRGGAPGNSIGVDGLVSGVNDKGGGSSFSQAIGSGQPTPKHFAFFQPIPSQI